MIRAVVAGAGGKMGARILAALAAEKDFEIAGNAGRSAPIEKALSGGADVVIDFSTPEASVHNARVCGEKGVALVIGTTGFSAGQRAEIGNAALTAQAPFSVTNQRVDAKLTGNPRQKVRFSISGFPPNKTVYGHWVFQRRVRATVAMGKVPAPCGIVSRRVRRIPARLRSGTWRIQFDTSRRYSARTTPRQILKLTVFRTVH